MKKIEKLIIFGILVISGVILGTMSLAKADAQNANIVIVVENEIDTKIPLEFKDSFKEEIILEKKWRQQLSKERSQLAFNKSQESTESKPTEVKTQNIKKEVSTTPTPTIPKPVQAKAKSIPTQPQKQTAQKNSPPAVSRGAGEVEQLLNRANSLIGVPYLWGGTTPKGFDCSGFVGYVFKASGISLPRTSFDMYKVGTPVKRDELKPGDLVFFSTYTEGASDVRIYIGGNSTIGASSGGVDIRSLSESYWDKHYYGARRVL